jgi:hypothetical protein
MRLRGIPVALATTSALALAATPALADPPSRVYKDASYGHPYYCTEWNHERSDYNSGGWHDCHFYYSDSYGRNCHAWVRWSHDYYQRGYWEGSYSEYKNEVCG